jgi:hypothetical protein
LFPGTRSFVFGLVSLLWTLPAFPQSSTVLLEPVNQPTVGAFHLFALAPAPAPVFLAHDEEALGESIEPAKPNTAGLIFDTPPLPLSDAPARTQPATPPDTSSTDSAVQPVEKNSRRPLRPDFNREIYYRNKVEFSLDTGWLPINIPFPLDIFVGDSYNTYPLQYTLVPVIASLRWHLDSPDTPWLLRGKFLRGNWDMQFSGSITAFPRGPESHYLSYDMGIRRNFVPRNSRVAPYFDVRLGMGDIDAKGPKGVPYAQGEDFTFTVNMGSGVRYNFNPRYALSAGLNFMHISNLDLSQHLPSPTNPGWGTNYGINVYGPMVGFYVTLGKPRDSEAR